VKTKAYIVLLGAGLLCGCSSTSLLPVDDVYYWPHSSKTSTATSAKTSTTTGSTTVTGTTVKTAPAGKTEKKIEYINVQDTTVTIRIKK
jgi:hypothetical protein